MLHLLLTAPLTGRKNQKTSGLYPLAQGIWSRPLLPPPTANACSAGMRFCRSVPKLYIGPTILRPPASSQGCRVTDNTEQTHIQLQQQRWLDSESIVSQLEG